MERPGNKIVLKAIAKLKQKYPITDIMKVVFMDSSKTKTNAILILKQYGIDNMKSL